IGYTAPSVNGQAKAIAAAYQKAQIPPATVSYIEAHGTGTRIGDPIEVAALTKAFRRSTDQQQYCGIGSVKTNIGHLDAGACIAGMIKTALSLKMEYRPASLHFKKPNPQIDFAHSPFFVQAKAQTWPRGAQPRRAGVSSLGLGGTNAHIILEEAPALLPTAIPNKSHQLLLLSAKTENALDQMTINLGHHLSKHPTLSLQDIAATLQLGRKTYRHRRFIIADDLTKLAHQLQANDNARLIAGQVQQGSPQLVFMFPGGGAQHVNMGRGLYEQEAAFREAVNDCLTILKEAHQLDLKSILYPKDDPSSSAPITNPLHGITLLFTIEYATARLWQSWGLQATELIGHSLGEYTAACIAGVFSLKDALALVTLRGQLFQKLPKGAMLSIPLPAEEISDLMAKELSFAAINKPDHCVLSGAVAAIDQMKAELNRREIHSTRLHISVAAHSHMVEAILPEFAAFLADIEFHPPSIPIVSNLDGQWADEQAIQEPAYWLQHLRQTVRFSDGLAQILENKNRILLEVGPGQTLSTFARQHPARQEQRILASLRHPKEQQPDLAFLLKSLGQLWLAGLAIDWKTINNAGFQRVSLPNYPFARERHWIEAKKVIPTKHSKPTIEQLTSGTEHDLMSTSQITRKTLLLAQLKDLFHELSGIPQEQMNEQASFLELGFDSLFLTQATSKIKKQLGIKLNFRQLFEEAPTLDALAHYADQQLAPEVFAEELQAMQAPQAKENPVPPSAPHMPNPNLAPVQPSAPTLSPTAHDSALSAEGLEGIMHRQLQIMEQQLQLLRGGQITTPPTATPTPAKPSQNGIHPAPQNGLTQTYTQKINPTKPSANGHGPWKPINKKNADGLSDQERKYLNDLIHRYTEKTKGSQELANAQRLHLADPRSITGFNRLWKDMVYQIAAERSKGAKIWDVDGNEYVDYRMAFGIGLFGHSPDFVKEAVEAQLEKGFELGVNTPLAHKVAQLLCEMTGMDRVTLVNTGSEAISAAMRAARTTTGKDKIAVFEGDYHGIADEVLVRSVQRNGQSISMPVSPGIPQFLVENVVVLKYDDPNVLAVIKKHAEDLAAVIIEPVQPNCPEHQPRELLHQIRNLTQAENIALVFDEMITGFRVAMRGAQEWYGVEADLVAYGKIISGGLPMAALAGRGSFMDCFDGGLWQFGDDSYPEAGVTFFGGTFVKHPLSLAAAYAALSEIKKRGAVIYEELNLKTARFAERLKALFIRTKVPLRIRSTASVLAIQVTDKNPLSRLFFYYVRLKGVHLKEKAGLMSLAHTQEDLDFTYQVIEESIREMQTAGFFKINLSPAEDQNIIVYPPGYARPNGIAQPLSNEQAVQPAGQKKKLPLSEGQKEVWVEQQLGMEAAAAYNLASDIQLKGPLDPIHLRNALRALCERHEALRTHYDRSAAPPVE
ncbi:MAG: aminotransferase class III-fold pyridoxal phosphate-dependent enzyme, partial [Bacteroidota bacterium]